MSDTLTDGVHTDWLAWFDGSAKPNPGVCKIACILRSSDGEEFQHTSTIGHGDSSDAEYQALIMTLKLLMDTIDPQTTKSILIRGDSQVVIYDVLNKDNGKSALLTHYREQAQHLMQALPNLELKWIPRHKNYEADLLLRTATHAQAIDYSA